MSKILLLYLFLLALPAQAQFEAQKYYERPLNSRDRDKLDWQIFPLHKNGFVLLTQESSGGTSKTQQVEFSHIDTTMQVKFSKNFTLSTVFRKHTIWQDDKAHNIYGVAQETEYSKKFYFFHLNLATQTGKEYQAEFPFTFQIEHLQISDDLAYFAGTSNNKWVTVTFNLLDGSLKLLPNFFEDREEIRHIYTDTSRHDLTFIVANMDYRNRKIFLQPYSSLIGNSKRIELQGRQREVRKRTFMEALAFHPKDRKNETWSIGAYSFEGQPYWQGLFVTKHKEQEQTDLTFYRFQDFAHFFKYLNPKRRQKMEDKMQEYNEKDKEYKFGRRLMWYPEYHENKNTIVLTFAGYHMQHPSQNNNPNWQMMSMRNPYYGGYRYLRPDGFNTMGTTNPMYFIYDYLVTVGFEKQTGRLIWDNMMKIEEVEDKQPRQMVQLGFVGDSLVTAYLHDDKIYSQLAYQRSYSQAIKEQELKYVLDGKMVDDAEDFELHTWYDNQFLLVGVVKRFQAAEVGEMRYNFVCARVQYVPKKDEPEKKDDKKKKKDKK